MAKTNKKLALKKETLRKLDSLTPDQLRAVAGGTNVAYGVVVPPSKTLTGGCDTSGCIEMLKLEAVYVVKGY